MGQTLSIMPMTTAASIIPTQRRLHGREGAFLRFGTTILAAALIVFPLGTSVAQQAAAPTPILPPPSLPSLPTLEPAQLPAPVSNATSPAAAPSPTSQVFPDGFPTLPATPSSPAANPPTPAVATTYPTTPYPELHSPTSDYGATGKPLSATEGSPGLFNYPVFPSILPDYYYRESYYNTYGLGARPIADYAPPGFEPRDYESAPGVPEFTPITPPPRPVAAGANNYVSRGMMPGSFLVPGTATSMRLRGFVRLAGMADFDPIGSADSFVTNTIPVPQEDGQNYNMSARMSRFALESWTPTSFHEWNVHTLIEGDFFNGPAQAAGGGGNPFRLRHAFVDFGYFRMGQQNSVFMDGTNWPSLVDFQGPNSWANQRQPSARMTLPIADRLYWATSIERCFSDITTNGLGTNIQEVPDLATHLRYEGDTGHVQVAAIMRTIGFEATGGEESQDVGGGLSGSLVFHPWAILMGTSPVRDQNPSGLTRSRILLQANWGPGLGRYVNDLAGQGLDAQVDPVTSELELVEAMAWNASYEHWYSETWLSNFTYSTVSVDNNAGQPGTTYNEAQYVAASLWWLPVPRMSVGVEYLFGQRENLDGQSADTSRLGALFQYNF